MTHFSVKNSLLFIDLTLTHGVSLSSWNMFWRPSPTCLLRDKTNSFRKNPRHSCVLIRSLESSTVQHALAGQNNDVEFKIKKVESVRLYLGL